MGGPLEQAPGDPTGSCELHSPQPFMLAKQPGYYDKIGVNVNLVDEPAGGDVTQNMLAGQVQGIGGFYDHNIAPQAQDKFSESVVSMLQIPGEVELCRSDFMPADYYQGVGKPAYAAALNSEKASSTRPASCRPTGRPHALRS